MGKVLKKEFFARPALEVAEDMIGKYLVKKFENGSKQAFKIIETEGYTGPEDKACHADEQPTERTKTMFEKPGTFYVYLIYGMYWMLNVITDEKGHPAGVLIRAVKPIKESGQFKKDDVDGPGKLTRELNIDKELDGKIAKKENGLWFEDRGSKIDRSSIIRKPRIGVEYAQEWADKPYRFILKE